MKIILPSIGRCGSNAIVRLLLESYGMKPKFTNSYEEMESLEECILKTHLHFRRELSQDYRAIFMYSDIEAVIASLYSLWNSPPSFHIRRNGAGKNPASIVDGLFYKSWFRRHLENLQVKRIHIGIFFRLAVFSKLLAFLYLTIGDKFRFKENMHSWRNSKNCIFVNYTELCEEKERIIKAISDFLGKEISPENFNVLKRKSDKKMLPVLLRKAIRITYPVSKGFCY